jgi:hypothetical protein
MHSVSSSCISSSTVAISNNGIGERPRWRTAEARAASSGTRLRARGPWMGSGRRPRGRCCALPQAPHCPYLAAVRRPKHRPNSSQASVMVPEVDPMAGAG